MSWTPERVETLKKLFAEGLAASVAASRLGGVTRNAVIGKWHRLGLVRGMGSSEAAKMGARVTRIQRQERAREEAKAKKKKPDRVTGQKAIVAELFRKVQLPSEPVPTAPDLVPTVRNLLDLEAHHCRWIPGEVSGGFCGRNKVDGLVYCDYHAKRAYAPAKLHQPPRASGWAKVDNIKLLDVAEFTAA